MAAGKVVYLNHRRGLRYLASNSTPGSFFTSRYVRRSMAECVRKHTSHRRVAQWFMTMSESQARVTNGTHQIMLCVLGICLTGGIICAAQSVDHGRRETPRLPTVAFDYSNALPAYFTASDAPDDIVGTDNTPVDNPVTDDGATLGRVLFYDTRLSENGTVACGSCHQQRSGFSDPRRLSIGVHGQPTRRHSMALANARYYARGKFFWDERAETLEQQVLIPIQDPVEMGMTLSRLETRLASIPYYPPLFTAAFGNPVVTRDRIARALAQFVRALVSHRSRYDAARNAGLPGSPAFLAQFTEPERRGHQLFVTVPGPGVRGAGCARCHVTDVQIVRGPRNIGLETAGDDGAGDARFKAPSLRNVAIRPPYMHDGRFTTLREVIEHYDHGIVAHPFLDMTLLDRRLAVTGGPVRPTQLNLLDYEKDALLAFLNTLTDDSFITDRRFADPFAPRPPSF